EDINNQLANNIIGGLSGFLVPGKGYQSSLNTWLIPENKIKICSSVINNYNQIFIYDYISLRG
ncbi:hypothetical protein, partial [Escherichia coli]